MRRMAGKGLAAIITVLLLCIFFSGTVKTLVTPKVKLVGVTTGRLRDTIPGIGKLLFSQTKEISPAADAALTVDHVYVIPGQPVKRGDALFSVSATDYDEHILTLTAEHRQIREQQLKHEANAVKLSRSDEKWFQAYLQLLDAQDALLTAQLDGAKDLAAFQQNVHSAQQAFDEACRIGVSDAGYAWQMEELRLQHQLDALTAQLASLQQAAGIGTIHAPYDGYVVEVNIRTGDPYDAHQPALVISGKSTAYLLRVDVSESERPVTTGMSATIKTPFSETIRSEVVATGVDPQGAAYADISIEETHIFSLQGAAALMTSGVPVSIQYTADVSTAQLPISAIRTDGNGTYVYTVATDENIFGSQVLRLTRQPVTVLDASDDMASIDSIPINAQIATMENRALAEGMEVIAYGNTP